MTRNKAMINRLLVAAPWLTILALAGLSLALPNRAEIGPLGEARKAEIAAAVAHISETDTIGRWRGQADDELAPEAQELLKPNASLSRRFTCPGGPWVHLVIVHCGDARDMNGHYPPICYPSNGWMELPAPANPNHVLTVMDHPFPVREYGYSSYLADGREEAIRILNAFILPDGNVTREIDDINRQSERLSVAVQGVAQVQVITSGRVPIADAISAAQEILNGMEGLFDALRFGQGAAQ